jgi:hypothetical protein
MIDGKGEPYSAPSKLRIVPLSARVRPVREPLILPVQEWRRAESNRGPRDYESIKDRFRRSFAVFV